MDIENSVYKYVCPYGLKHGSCVHSWQWVTDRECSMGMHITPFLLLCT